MTDREKVIKGLNDLHGVACGLGGDQCYLNSIGIKELQTLINDATKLLKAQEPCEDAVSRYAVSSMIQNSCANLEYRTDREELVGELYALPSVQPVPVVRVMTLEEVSALDADEGENAPVWMETRIVTDRGVLTRLEASILWTVEKDWWRRFGPVHSGWEDMRTKDYDITWRCWTSRPTDEQRKAVKWE